MKLPSTVLAIRDRYVAKFPLPNLPAGTPSDVAEDKARQWTLGFISQVEFELPGQGYCSKRSGKTNPLSKDGIAQEVGATLLVWDLMSGAGTGKPTMNANPDSEDITGQIPEHVQGRDVIGGAAPPSTGTGPTPPASGYIPYDENKSVQFGLGCNDVYKESGAAFDPGMIAVHASRAAWDYYVGGLTWDVSYKKHINAFRAVYGLSPV